MDETIKEIDAWVEMRTEMLDRPATRMLYKPADTRPELLALLIKAKDHKMTPEERHAQRVSWVYGNLALSDDRITREQVERHLQEDR